MKNKIGGIYLSVVALIIASMFALSFLAANKGYKNLLLITPSVFGVPGLSAEKLEELSAEEFLLTYEIRRPAVARAINSGHSVTLVGTNHNYAGIMGYSLLDGGFFTAAATDAKSKHAVLNETAAFKLFGSNKISGGTLKLDGETWIITGVIQDNDEDNANIYIPYSLAGGRVDSIMALMDEKTVNEAYIKNAVKSIGVHENSYNFINLSRLAESFGERLLVALKAALFAGILVFILNICGSLPENLHFYRERMRGLYFSELLAHHRADFLKTAGSLLLLVFSTMAMLALSLQILGTCLTWRELPPVTGELAAGDFGHKLIWLRDYQIFDSALFGVCICLILLGIISVITGRTWKIGARVKNGETQERYRRYKLAKRV